MNRGFPVKFYCGFMLQSENFEVPDKLEFATI